MGIFNCLFGRFFSNNKETILKIETTVSKQYSEDGSLLLTTRECLIKVDDVVVSNLTSVVNVSNDSGENARNVKFDQIPNIFDDKYNIAQPSNATISDEINQKDFFKAFIDNVRSSVSTNHLPQENQVSGDVLTSSTTEGE